MITTLFHAAGTVTTSTVTRRGRGRRGEEEGGGRSPATHAALEGGRGGGENDLVSRGQHSHDIHETSTTSHERGERGELKYRMLHIPGILDCTYHLHVSVSVCSRFLA